MLHAHGHLVELAVVRMRRLVGDQVVGARVADYLTERGGDVVLLDDRASARLAGEGFHRIVIAHEPTHDLGAGRPAVAHRQASGIERIERHVRPAGGLIQIAHVVDLLRESLADEDDGLPALLDPAEMRRQAFERGVHDLAPESLDVPRIAQMHFLDRILRRKVFAPASVKRADRPGHLLAVAAEGDVGDRVERVEDCHEIRRRQLPDERQQRLDHAQLVQSLYVIVVEDDGVDAHVVTRRFALLVLVRADRRKGRVCGILGGAKKAHAVDRHRLAVVKKLEVRGGEIGDRKAVVVGDDRVDLHEVRAAAKRRRLRGLWRLRRLRRRVERRREERGGQQPDPSHVVSMITFGGCSP
jgi:hypothetical protein